MIKYDKLFDMFKEKGVTSYVVRQNKLMGQGTLTKIKNGTSGLDYKTIDKLCAYLNCQPADIMEYVPDEQVEVVAS